MLLSSLDGESQDTFLFASTKRSADTSRSVFGIERNDGPSVGRMDRSTKEGRKEHREGEGDANLVRLASLTQT